jgi:hypothetical protein
MDPSIDLRDHRGRLIRFAIAVAIGLGATMFLLHEIRSVAAPPNADPISGSSVALLAVGLFVVISAVSLTAITTLARRMK